MIGITRDGVPVFDRHLSHSHVLIEDVREALSRISPPKRFCVVSCEMDKEGLSFCVPTQKGDDIYYDVRPRRRGPSRMVRGKNPIGTKTLTLILKYVDEPEERFVLITAFWGDPAEPEPWDTNAFSLDPRGFEEARKASLSFWESHALATWGETIFSCED